MTLQPRTVSAFVLAALVCACAPAPRPTTSAAAPPLPTCREPDGSPVHRWDFAWEWVREPELREPNGHLVLGSNWRVEPVVELLDLAELRSAGLSDRDDFSITARILPTSIEDPEGAYGIGWAYPPPVDATAGTRIVGAEHRVVAGRDSVRLLRIDHDYTTQHERYRAVYLDEVGTEPSDEELLKFAKRSIHAEREAYRRRRPWPTLRIPRLRVVPTTLEDSILVLRDPAELKEYRYIREIVVPVDSAALDRSRAVRWFTLRRQGDSLQVIIDCSALSASLSSGPLLSAEFHLRTERPRTKVWVDYVEVRRTEEREASTP